jgi:hypothetical protein
VTKRKDAWLVDRHYYMRVYWRGFLNRMCIKDDGMSEFLARSDLNYTLFKGDKMFSDINVFVLVGFVFAMVSIIAKEKNTFMYYFSKFQGIGYILFLLYFILNHNTVFAMLSVLACSNAMSDIGYYKLSEKIKSMEDNFYDDEENIDVEELKS